MQNKSLVALRISLTCLALMICAVSLFGYPLLHVAAPSHTPIISGSVMENQTVTLTEYSTSVNMSVYTQWATLIQNGTRTLINNQTLATIQTLPGHNSTVTVTTTKSTCTPHVGDDCD